MKSIIFSLVIGILSTIITFLDKDFKYQELCLFLYFLSTFSILVSSIFFLVPKIKEKPNSQFKFFFIIILVLAVISRFIFLSDYPFVALGDEVRDGGLNATQIFHHEISNIFAYGRYDAHGLIIPTITSFFYSQFGNSVLTYRLPAALIGIFDILLIYIFIALVVSPKAGFWSGIILISLSLHLFYSRTQIVVIFSSFLTTCLLIGTYFYFSKINYWRFIFLGTLIGISFNFHASVKTVALLILITTIINELRHLSVSKIKNIILLLSFVLIGFGPRILFTPPNIFFHTSRLEPINQLILTLPQRYLKSVLVWFLSPTQSFFNNNLPLLHPFLFGLIIVGIILYLKVGKKYIWLKYFWFLALVIPLINSAITDGINLDHRLSPLFPIASILTGYGIYLIIQKSTNFFLKLLVIFAIIIFLSCQTIGFFTNRLADVNWNNFPTEKDYLSIHLINFIKTRSKLSSKLCLRISPQIASYFNLVHVQEQYQYFLPQYSINFVADEKTTSPNSVYLDYNCRPSTDYQLYTYSCSSFIDFSCPRYYRGQFLIYY